MAPQSSQVPWRRMVFGVLFVFALVVPISLWFMGARAHVTDPASYLNLFRIWCVATAALLVWSALYIREEPQLAQVALGLVALVFVFLTFFARAFSRPSSSTVASAGEQEQPSAQPTTQHAVDGGTQKTAKAPASDKVEDTIVGKWQLGDLKTTITFLKDKTFLTVLSDGRASFGRYLFLDPDRLQLFLLLDQSDKPIFFADILIKGDTMTRTVQSGKASYQRLPTYEDTAGVTGIWTTNKGNLVMFVTDRTFAFGHADFGSWEMKGGQVVAKSTAENGATWTLTLSSDGHTLSGGWTKPDGDKGNTTLIRPPKLDKLTDYIVGRWQLVGHVQTHEYGKDGSLILKGDDGNAQTIGYSIPDENHVQILLQGGKMKPPPWTIVRINEDVMTNQASPKSQPSTYVRIR